MTVYIEQVVVDNFAVNLLILLLCATFQKRRRVWWRLLLSAAVGAAFAVAYPFVNKFLLGYKLLCAAVMTALYLKYENIRQYLLGLVFFFGVSFLFGGAVSVLLNLNSGIGGAMTVGGFGLYGILLLSVMFGAYFLRQVKYLWLKKLKYVSGKAAVRFEFCGKCFKVNAFFDSGNGLYDGVTGLPVSVVAFREVEKCLKGDERLIGVKTVAGEVKMAVIAVCGLQIDDWSVGDALFAVSKSLDEDVGLILHGDLACDGVLCACARTAV